MGDSREANLKALSEQLAKLEAAMNLPEEPIQGLFKKMNVHLDVLGSACKQQAANADLDVPEFQKLISLIKEHHVVWRNLERLPRRVQRSSESRDRENTVR